MDTDRGRQLRFRPSYESTCRSSHLQSPSGEVGLADCRGEVRITAFVLAVFRDIVQIFPARSHTPVQLQADGAIAITRVS